MRHKLSISRMGEGNITSDPPDFIKRIKKEYNEQYFAPKLDNLCEIDKFFEKYKLLKLNEENDNLNSLITVKLNF